MKTFGFYKSDSKCWNAFQARQDVGTCQKKGKGSSKGAVYAKIYFAYVLNFQNLPSCEAKNIFCASKLEEMTGLESILTVRDQILENDGSSCTVSSQSLKK